MKWILFFLCTFGLYAELDFTPSKMVLSTKRIYFPNYSDAHNPSIFKIDEGFIFTFRYVPDRYLDPWTSYLGVVLLNEKLEPISEPELLQTRGKDASIPPQSEDPRIFSYRGRLFVLYNDSVDVLHPTYWDRRDLFLAELHYKDRKFTLSAPMKLYYAEKYNTAFWQKNWVPFVWNKKLLFGYSINPHEIIYPNLLNGECYHCYESFKPLEWNLGTLRGSSAAEVVDGEYLAFFHSGFKMQSPYTSGWELWHYFMGAYTFASEPPFELKKISSSPIIGEGFYTESPHNEKRVIFPGGYVVDGPYIYLAYGKDDCEMWIAKIDKKELLTSLVTLPKEKFD